MIRGCDFSLARPDPKKLKGVGFQFACRYLTNGGLNGKALSPAELVALRNAGLAVVLNFEESGSFGTGYVGGRADALKAQDARFKLGLPASVIYFSCEANARFDLAYLRGAASVLGKGNVGAYVVQAHAKEVADAGYWLWEACWGCADGSFDPRAQLRQILGGQPFDGVPDAIDIDVATVDNYGQVGGTDEVPLTKDQEDAINFSVGMQRHAEGLPRTAINPGNTKALEGWDYAESVKQQIAHAMLPPGTQFQAQIQ